MARARKLDPDSVQIVISEAIAKRKANKITEAISLLTKATKEHSGNVKAHLELLETYQAGRKHKDAVTQFKAIEKQFGDVDSVISRAAVILGKSFLKQRDSAQAYDLFSAAIKTDPKNVDAYYYKGYAIKGDKKMNAEAIIAFSKYVDLSPNGEHSANAKKYIEALK